MSDIPSFPGAVSWVSQPLAEQLLCGLLGGPIFPTGTRVLPAQGSQALAPGSPCCAWAVAGRAGGFCSLITTLGHTDAFPQATDGIRASAPTHEVLRPTLSIPPEGQKSASGAEPGTQLEV